MPDKIKLKNIITKATLSENANQIKKKRLSPGFDGMSTAGAVSWITIYGDRLCRDILDGDYSPMPAIEFRSAKSQGGYRTLARLSVLDTIIQTTLNRELAQISESFFSDSSFAYRQGRGVSTAVQRCVYLADKNKYAAKIDIASCFDNINHAKLCQILNGFFGDKHLVEFVHTCLKMPIYRDNEIVPRQKGLVQGAPLSPLLCNLYFHIADKFMEDNGITFVRYADDIVLFSDSHREICRSLKKTSEFLEQELLLKCNLDKTKISSSGELVFLGHKFKRTKKGVIDFETESEENCECYLTWNKKDQTNNRQKINIVSDGILRQKDLSVFFDTEGGDTLIPPAATDIINVYSNVIFDSRFFSVAAKNGITVNLFNNNGERLGSFVPDSNLKSPPVIHEQLTQYYDTARRVYLAREFLLSSVHNTVLNIRYYNKQNENEQYIDALNKIASLKRKIKVETSVENLLLLEAKVRHIYYNCYDLFCKKDDFKFEKRTQRPPKNKFNALLSFGNAVLYNHLACEIQKTSLDIRVGFLHATTTRLHTLNLDMAEIFKPLLVDRVILSLINRGALSDNHFLTSNDGTTVLTQRGKDIFLKAFCNKLETEITVKGEGMKYAHVITEEVRKLVRHFKNKEQYKAFRQVR